MARTKTSARKVTGGMRPSQQLAAKRRQLATMAATPSTDARATASEAAKAAQVKGKKNHARKTTSEPCKRLRIRFSSPMDLDSESDSDSGDTGEVHPKEQYLDAGDGPDDHDIVCSSGYTIFCP